jgi:hypothetical protein
MGLFVKPTKPSKQLHIKLIEKFKHELKASKPKKQNRTKKLITTPL